MNKTQKQLSDILHKHFADNKAYLKAQQASIHASWSIHFGPDSTSIWSDRRYCAALNRMKRFIESELSDLWVDLDCDYVTDTEPESHYLDDDGAYQEYYLDETYAVTRNEVAKLLFGVSADYI